MCWGVLVKLLLKTSNNFEAVLGLEIDMGVRFLLKSSRPHSSQQSQALCWLCLAFITDWRVVSPIMTQILGMTAILCCDMLWKLCHFYILSDMEEAWKTTIPKNPAFDYTYVNENILAKVKKVMFGGKLLIQPEKSSLKKTIKVHSSVIRGW